MTKRSALIALVLFVGVIFWLRATTDPLDPVTEASDGFTWPGFVELVGTNAECRELFDYRGALQIEEEWTTEPLNKALRKVGCATSSSERADLIAQREGLVKPADACRLVFSEGRGSEPNYGMLWSVVAQERTRRVLQRHDGNYAKVTLCDIEIRGAYSDPVSTEVYSVFVMDTVGVAPDEELPSESAMLAEAAAQR